MHTQTDKRTHKQRDKYLHRRNARASKPKEQTTREMDKSWKQTKTHFKVKPTRDYINKINIWKKEKKKIHLLFSLCNYVLAKGRNIIVKKKEKNKNWL